MAKKPTYEELEQKIKELEKETVEHKRAEEALRESEERHSKLFEEALDGIFVGEAETGVIIDCNRAAAKLVGRDKSELIGQHQTMLHPPHQVNEEFSETFKKHLGESEGQVLETQVITSTGEIKEVAIKANLIHIGDRKLIQGIFRDITERKRAEEALQESEEKYKTLTENSLTGINIKQDEKIVFVNDRYAEMHGYKRDELLGKHFLTLYHPDYRELTKQRASQRLKGESVPQRYEVQRLRKDGEVIWCEMMVRQIEYQGKPAIMANVLDISERKRAEEALKREKQRAEKYLHIAGVMLATVDADENLTLINRKGCKILGYNEEELIGRNWFDILVPERIRGEVRGVFRKLMDGHVELVEYHENPLLTKDGEERLISFHNTVIRNPNGQIVGILSSGEDITEKKLAEEDLCKYRQIVNTANDHLALLDKNYIYQAINDDYLKTFNKRREDIIGHYVAEVFGQEIFEKTLKTYADRCLTGEIVQHQFWFDSPGLGRQCWDATLYPYFGTDNQILGLVVNSRKITDLKRAEEDLRKARDELEKQVKERTAELVTANKQLTTEIKERKLAEEKLKASLKEKEMLLKEIHHRVKNNLQIISSLLDMSRRRTKNQEAIDLLSQAGTKIHAMALIHTQLYRSERFDQIDMQSHIRDMIIHLSQLYGAKNYITPIINASDIHLPVIQAIPCALALNELIYNVFKHAFQDGEEGTLEISIEQSSDGTISLKVKDDGIGIPEEIDINGTDTLGLKLVRNLVLKQLRGKLQIERNNGTEVFIEFRAVQEEAEYV